MPTANAVDPCDFVIFGGTGDLAIRKLLPALYLRDRDGQLTADTRIIAVARAGLDEPGYRDKIRAELGRFVAADELDDETVDRFLARLRFTSIDLTAPEEFSAVADLLSKSPVDIRVFYLACAPALFGPICDALGRQGMITASSRVVLEKPIGRDLATARAINDAVARCSTSSQIFRIDHYLGKETVQNLLVTAVRQHPVRAAVEHLTIDHVQITVAETSGVGDRGDYYDKSGALRDMLQNHMLQLLCLVAMEPPARHGPRRPCATRRSRCCRRSRRITRRRQQPADRARPVRPRPRRWRGGDRATATEPTSRRERTETFVALRAEIDNWRWAGRAVLSCAPASGCRSAHPDRHPVQARAALDLPGSDGADPSQPPGHLRCSRTRSMRLELTDKEPGPGGMRLRPVSLALNYTQAFQRRSPDAYERLLMDVVRGDPTLFMRRDEVEAAWAWAEPILRQWQNSGRVPRNYPAGTDGPVDAATLLERDGRRWHEGAA